MLIKSLAIKNFRCFGDTPTFIDLSNSGLTAFIGANNVGKSTVLKALEILLGDKWPTGQFSEDDFHNNELSNEIILACEFANRINIEVSDITIPVAGVVVRAQHLSTGYGENSIDVEYRLLETMNNIDSLFFERLDLATYRFRGGSRGDRPIFVSQEIRNKLPIAITIPLIKLHSEQPVNKWGVLGRMLQKVEHVLAQDKNKDLEFKEKMEEAVGILREPEEFQRIEADIKDFWDKMKPANLSATNLEFLDYEPWRYYRQFKLAIKRHGQEVPIDTLGEGVQRLAVIALYRTYLRCHGRNERAVLLIEEPESYLHPQARGTLFHVLKKAISERYDVEGQILYTTHSEDFVDYGDFDDIAIFSEAADGVEVRHITEDVLKHHTLALGYTEAEISDQHIHYRLLETTTIGFKEALFAHKAIIVEGPSEIELFRFFTEAEKNQIAIVSAGGKSNIPSVYSFLTAFGIPCLVAIDRDGRGESENERVVSVLSEINARHPDSLKIDIDIDEINGVEDGEIFVKRHLLIFGKNLETVLDKQVESYCDLLSDLRRIFKLPREKGPRDIQALGLAYSGNCVGNTDLETKIENAKEQLGSISEVLNDFTQQEVRKPAILTNQTSE